MRYLFRVSLLLIAFTLLQATASVAHASDYKFNLHNKSSGWTIEGFYTFQNGKWSKNWLTGKIAPGKSVGMDWISNEGECVVPFRVSWVDYGSEDHKLDWCKNVKNVYMKDKGFTTD